MLEAGRHCSSWWKSVCRIREGLGEGVRGGLMITFVVWLEMVGRLSFGTIIG